MTKSPCVFLRPALALAATLLACNAPQPLDERDGERAGTVAVDDGGDAALTGAEGPDEVAQMLAPPQPRGAWMAAAASGWEPGAVDPRSASADDASDRARLAASLAGQRLATLVEGFVDEGLAALDRGELAEAHRLFANAWQLDPTHEAARDLYHRTAALAGDDRASLGALAADARTLAAVRSQQRAIDIEQHLSRGRSALAGDDPEAALVHFEDALTLVRFHPDATRSTVTEDEIDALMTAARQRHEELLAARDAELQRRADQAQDEWDHAERNRVTLKIQGLLSAANDAFLADDFDGAIASLDEALALDPLNADADALRGIAVKAKSESAARAIRRAYSRQWTATFDDLRHDTLIPNDLLTFPDSEAWAETVARGPKSFAPQQAEVPRDDLQVRERLDQVAIPYEFDGNNLADVLDHLREVTGLNFLVSPAAAEAGESQSYSVADKHAQPVSRILAIVLEEASIPALTHTVRDGIVRIVTQEEFRGESVLELYDVRDLTWTPRDFQTEDFNLLPSGVDSDSFTQGVEDEEPMPRLSEDEIQSMILETISPDSWTAEMPEGALPNSLSVMSGTLVIRQSPEVHAQIKSLLSELRANTSVLINIQTRFIEVEDTFLEDIGVDLRGLDATQGAVLEDFGQPLSGSAGSGVGTPSDPAGIGSGIDSGAFYTGPHGELKGRTENLFDSIVGEPGVMTGGGGMALEALFLDDSNVKAVLRAVTKYQNSNLVNAPSLTIRSGQRGNVKVLEHRTYVRDFEPEIATAAVIAMPEIAVVRSGIVLDVRAVASADRRFVTLEIRPTVAELVPDRFGNVLPEVLVSLGTPNANNVTLHLPELQIQRLRTTSTIPDGGTLLLGGLKTNVETDQASEVPFLSDIPVLGFFFSRKGEYTSRRKLLILLTAQILAPEEQEPELR